jgi:hypothetical protein
LNSALSVHDDDAGSDVVPIVESLSVVVLADPDAVPVGVPPALAVEADRARRFDDPVDVDDVDAFAEELRRFDREAESLDDDDRDEPELDDDDRDELRRFDRDDESLDDDDRDEPELDDDDDREDELRRFEDPEEDDRDEPELDDDRDEPEADDRDDPLDDEDRRLELPLLVVEEPPDALVVDPLREDPPSSVRHALGSGMPEVRFAT